VGEEITKNSSFTKGKSAVSTTRKKITQNSPPQKGKNAVLTKRMPTEVVKRRSMRNQTRNNKATHLTVLAMLQRNKEGHKAIPHSKD